jgi:hypothetical protein
MSKKNTPNTEVQNNEVVVTKTVNVVTTTIKHPGRPINPDSPRQQRLREMEERRLNGSDVKRGRPVNPDSVRQHRLATMNTGVLGRPVNPDSARQQRLALKGTLPLGRPKKVNVDVEAEISED